VRNRSTFALARILHQRGMSGKTLAWAPEVAALLGSLDRLTGFRPTDRWKTVESSALQDFYAQQMGKQARSGAVGMVAPATAGLDLDGNSVDLARFRGRAVLVVFWSTWCRPCMAMVPHEVKLSEAYRGRPFAILGVNCDASVKPAKAAAAKFKMTWPSLQCPLSDDSASHVAAWDARALPTVCLIDHAGVVRHRWTGDPTEELDRAVREAVAAAEAAQKKDRK
jgi:thiol-disulfide isomerase/thioredoxin